MVHCCVVVCRFGGELDIYDTDTEWPGQWDDGEMMQERFRGTQAECEQWRIANSDCKVIFQPGTELKQQIAPGDPVPEGWEVAVIGSYNAALLIMNPAYAEAWAQNFNPQYNAPPPPPPPPHDYDSGSIEGGFG